MSTLLHHSRSQGLQASACQVSIHFVAERTSNFNSGSANNVRNGRQELIGIWLIISILLFGMVGCSDSGDDSRQSRRGAGAGGPVTVEVTAVTETTLSSTIEALGTTRANESVTVTAKVTDTIGRVSFEDGDFVEAGSILVELTSDEEQALLAEAQANLRDAQNQLNRIKDLRSSGVVSAANFDEAQARVDGSRARLNTIVARLKDRLVRAPFAGLLGFRQVSAGTLITPGTAITTLDDVSVIKLDFTVPETALSALAQGQAISARSAAYGSREFVGEVSSVGSRVDPVTRAVVVRALIENADRALRPGMLMTVRLVTDQRQALVVPEAAVIQLGDESFVFAVDSQMRARKQVITAGTRKSGVVEVIEGLQLEDQVISEGIIKVRDGATVQLIGDSPLSARAPVEQPVSRKKKQRDDTE